MRPVLPLLLVLLTAAPSAARAQAPSAAQVTIYRCVAANGTVALRDSPCLKGEKQEVRAMQRPQDPPARPAAVAPAPAPQAAPEPPSTRVVYLSPPKPMYECTTPEGQTYTSDNDDGNPRWVPYGGVYSGYPVYPRSGGSVSGNVSIGNGNLSFESGDRRPRPPGGGGHHPGPGPVFVPGGAWVRDTCHPLPQEEVCARLSDRRYEILRRYGAALPSERRTLDLEQRGIDARLANDCR
jgi:hypothetical protein